MNSPRPFKAAAALLCLWAASGCSVPLNDQIVGTYVNTTVCDPLMGFTPPVYLHAQVSFSTLNYDSQFTYYSDSSCTTASLVYEVQGGYSIGQPSAVVDGATEVEFDVNLRLLTPQNPMTTTTLNGLMNCGTVNSGGWLNGQRRDITVTGCAGLIPSCKAEYNIIELADNQLSIGKEASVGANCTMDGRPITLGAALQKQVM